MRGRCPRREQRRGSQNSTSAPGDAIWGAHRCNYTHGQFGGTVFVPQGPPPPPRCTPVVIYTKLTSSRLSLAPCCAGQPSFGHIQAAPRRALLPLDSILRRFLVPWHPAVAATNNLTADLLLTRRVPCAWPAPELAGWCCYLGVSPLQQMVYFAPQASKF
jgi:hypothetical protein